MNNEILKNASEINERNKRKYFSVKLVVVPSVGNVLTESGDNEGGAPFSASWGEEWEDK